MYSYDCKRELKKQNEIFLLEKKEWDETFKTIYGNAKKLADENKLLKEKYIILQEDLAIADKTIEELSQPLRELINGVKSLNKRKSRRNKNLNN